MTSRSTFDAFLSYSRKDLRVAVELERALERYTPPRDLRPERRPIAVCRDQDDLTGPEYYAAIDDHLKRSKKFVLLCSPHSRASEFVNDEIRRFAAIHGSAGIIPVLLAGLPNNAAREGDADQLAFPDALVELVTMPLAVAYTGFNPDRDRVNKGVFYGSWYTLLANLLDVDRAAIEERDRRRKARLRNTWIGGTTGVVVALSALTLWALVERRTAVRRGQVTLAQRLAAQARVATSLEPDAARQRAILGVEGVRRLTELGEPTYDAATALREAVAPVPWLALHLDAGHDDVVFAGDGLTAFAARGPNVSVYALRSGTRLATFDAAGPVRQLFASRAGGVVGAITGDGRLGLWRGPDWRPVVRATAIGSAGVACAGLSADGRYLATLATDRSRARVAQLAVWRVDSARVVVQQALAIPNDSVVPPAHGCVELEPDHLIVRYRASDTASTIAGAVWAWRPAREADPLSLGLPSRAATPLRQWPRLSQLAWPGDTSSTVVLLDAAGRVTTVSLDGGPDVVPPSTRNSFAAISNDGQVLLRMRWSEDPYVPLLKSWLITAVDRQSGADRGVVAETTNQLALSRDGVTMVTGAGRKLRLWRTADGRELMRIAPPISVERVMVSPEARYIATWDSVGAVDIWDVAHASELLRVPTGRVAATSADGKRVAIGTPSGVAVIDQVTGGTIAAIPLVGGAGFVALSADGRYLVASGGDPRGFNFRPEQLRTVVLDLTRGADTVFAGSRATAAAFDSAGAALVLGTSDSVVRFIELAGRKLRWAKRYDAGHATRISFSGDGRTVGVALEPPLRSSAAVVAVNPQSGAEVARIDNRETNAFALSPDGTEIATAVSGVVEVSAVRDGRVTTRLRHPPTLETIRQIAFLPGNRLMTAAGSIASAFMGTPFFTEQAVFVWNRTTGTVEYRLPDVQDRAKDYSATLGEEEKPYFGDVTWSPNGAEIAATVFASRLSYWTVPADLAPRDVRIWRLGAARPEEVYRAGMDDDSRLVGLDDRAGLVFTAGRSLRAWNYRAATLVAETCRRITRQLSAAEWRALVSPNERPRATCR